MASFYTSTIKVNDVPMDPAAVTAQFVPVISASPDWHWEIRHIVVDGDNIAVHFTVTGTHRGAFQGIEATGRRVTVSEFTLYHAEDGKFAEVWDLTDMDAVMRHIRRGEAPLTAPADEAGTADRLLSPFIHGIKTLPIAWTPPT
jgi:predicted ester cyclase